MYGFLNDAGAKRKERAYDSERLVHALPRELDREAFPEAQVFEQLVEANSSLDRRISESLQLWNGYFGAQREGGAGAVPRTLRVCVYNTHHRQEGRYRLDSADPPSWTLRVEGRLLPDAKEATQAAPAKFSQFVQQLSVALPGGAVCRWDSREQGARAEPVDGFEITRTGNQETRVTVTVTIGYPVALFSLSPLLTQLLGVAVETRDQVLRGLFLYAQQHRLATDPESGRLVADETLQRLFGVAQFQLTDIPKLIEPMLNPPPPIVLDCWVRVSGTPQETLQCWDVTVQDPSPSVALPSALAQKILQIDREVARAADELAAQTKQHRALRELSRDPARFVHSMARSNAQDASLLQACEAPGSDEFLYSSCLDDSVRQYLLSKRLKADDAH